eukprot:TRINITY_DN5734_c0_g1_i3.p1 TRINITY_DN5734_c0_g1~~TRINITY_DN5734_c0_g1_i3.p1  ORF type:complete len:598 (+),score=114.99 TRINITY_DN5734_c0_g1_i3:216-2009(+)
MEDMSVSRRRLGRTATTTVHLPPLSHSQNPHPENNHDVTSGKDSYKDNGAVAGGGHVLRRLQQCLQKDRSSMKRSASALPSLSKAPSAMLDASARSSSAQTHTSPTSSRTQSSSSAFAVIPASKFQPRNLLTALPETVSLPKRREVGASTSALSSFFTAATAAAKWQRKSSNNVLKRGEGSRGSLTILKSSTTTEDHSMSIRQQIQLEEEELEKAEMARSEEASSQHPHHPLLGGSLSTMEAATLITVDGVEESRRARRIDKFSSLLLSIVSETTSQEGSSVSTAASPSSSSSPRAPIAASFKPSSSTSKRKRFKTAEQEDDDELALLESDTLAYLMGTGSLGGGRGVSAGPGGSISLSEGRKQARLLTNWSRGWWEDNVPSSIHLPAPKVTPSSTTPDATTPPPLLSPRPQLLTQYTHLYRVVGGVGGTPGNDDGVSSRGASPHPIGAVAGSSTSLSTTSSSQPTTPATTTTIVVVNSPPPSHADGGDDGGGMPLSGWPQIATSNTARNNTSSSSPSTRSILSDMSVSTTPSRAPIDRLELEESYLRGTIIRYCHEGYTKFVSRHLLTVKEIEGDEALEEAELDLMEALEALAFNM